MRQNLALIQAFSLATLLCVVLVWLLEHQKLQPQPVLLGPIPFELPSVPNAAERFFDAVPSTNLGGVSVPIMTVHKGGPTYQSGRHS